MKRLVSVLILACATWLAHAGPISGFNGAYAPANWSGSNSGGGDGTWSIDANSAQLTGSNNGSGDATTSLGLTSAHQGFIEFSWAYQNNDVDAPGWDSFGYLLNNVFTQLNDGLLFSESGLASIFLDVGDSFAFAIWSLDGLGGAASVSIRDFSGPGSLQVPEPASLALLSLALLAATAASRRRARR